MELGGILGGVVGYMGKSYGLEGRVVVIISMSGSQVSLIPSERSLFALFLRQKGKYFFQNALAPGQCFFWSEVRIKSEYEIFKSLKRFLKELFLYHGLTFPKASCHNP